MVAIVSLATAFCALGLSAQTRWGITGGFGWSQSNVNEIIENQAPAGWNAGLTISFDLPLGFSLQPTFRYHHKDAMLTNTIGQSMSYVEVPVSLQWGPDLLLFRPFIDATPFVGYALANETYSTIDLPGGLLSGARLSKDSLTGWEGKQRVGYGIGLGGGDFMAGLQGHAWLHFFRQGGGAHEQHQQQAKEFTHWLILRNSTFVQFIIPL